MKKIKNPFNLLKIICKTSYDTSKFIDPDTKKLNKKSAKVWLVGIMIFVVFYFSYTIINFLKNYQQEKVFISVACMLISVMIVFETVLLCLSVMYFADDIRHYLSLPIPAFKLFYTKYATMTVIIFVSEILMALPSFLTYGASTSAGIWYYISLITSMILVTFILSGIITLGMILLMKVLNFIKNKVLFQNIVIFIMIIIIFLFTNVSLKSVSNEVFNENFTIKLQNAESTVDSIFNRFFITSLGIQAMKKDNYTCLIEISKLFAITIIVLICLLVTGRMTYINDILKNASVLEKKNKKKIKLKKSIGKIHKNFSYIKNELKIILKTPTYVRHYIYNVFIFLMIFKLLFNFIYPIVVDVIFEIGEDAYYLFQFDFGYFSIIIGLIQVFYTLSPLSLTAFSRYGKNAKFFKYIPIDLKTQFRLKNAPQILLNFIIALSIIRTIHSNIPSLDSKYYYAMIIVAILLNIINSYLALMMELKRPQLNYENEISIIKQNENKLFQYIMTIGMCVLIWYIYSVTKKMLLNNAIIVEIIAFVVIIVILEVILWKKGEKLYRKIN
jgi:ABC-2 type transport system permease protein